MLKIVVVCKLIYTKNWSFLLLSVNILLALFLKYYAEQKLLLKTFWREMYSFTKTFVSK